MALVSIAKFRDTTLRATAGGDPIVASSAFSTFGRRPISAARLGIRPIGGIRASASARQMAVRAIKALSQPSHSASRPSVLEDACALRGTVCTKIELTTPCNAAAAKFSRIT